MTDMAQGALAPLDQLALLYLASPALPIGAFAYSQGLEQAIERGSVLDRDTLMAWAQDMLVHGLSELEGPLLLALSEAVAAQDEQALNHFNDLVFACRETQELYEEERYLGQSLGRLLKTQDLLAQTGMTLPKQASFLATYAMAGNAMGLAPQSLLLGFMWSWLENQVTVSCKTIPLGQSDAQKVLLGLRPLIAEQLGTIAAADYDFKGASLPGQAMLSALHEVQYSRLFRS